MSAWRILVRRLYDQGGGPLRRCDIDPHGSELGEAPKEQLDAARRDGLVEATRVKVTWTWTLTQRGRDWCEGRVEVVEARREHQRGRRPKQLRATWLAALPKAGEIRL